MRDAYYLEAYSRAERRREQAEIGIALQEHIRSIDAGVWRSLLLEDLDYREGLKQRIHELNHRGCD